MCPEKNEGQFHTPFGISDVQLIFQSLQEREGLDMSWVEVQFLRNAVDVLQKSRQILMFTYVFAFYLQKSNNTTIFEDNQVIIILLNIFLFELRRIWNRRRKNCPNTWNERCPRLLKTFQKSSVQERFIKSHFIFRENRNLYNIRL